MSDTSESLYERIGGEEGIRKFVSLFYARVLADEELAPFFKDVSMEVLERMQLEFFSAALGGPQIYSGRPLHHVHAGKGIRARHLDRFVEHQLATLKDLEITDQDRQDIAERINLLATDITEDSEFT